MPELYTILRGGFVAAGIDRQRGEVVDTSAWRNVQPLVSTRYLAPVTGGSEALAKFVSTDDGRVWVDEDAALAHQVRVETENPTPSSAGGEPATTSTSSSATSKSKSQARSAA